MIAFQTQRMIFRIFEEQDRDLVKELDSDPDVVRYISNGIPSDDKEIDRAMGIFLSLNKKFNNKLGFWKAINKETNEFMGWFHFRPLKSDPEDTSQIELGYRLKKKFWGKGYATEGSQVLVDQGLKDPTIKKIWAHAMLVNEASINIMKKVGLQFHSEEIYEQWPGEDKRCIWYLLDRSN